MIEFSIQKKLNTSTGVMLLELNHSFESGKFLTIYGESGAGKTSTLRMLAGLLTPDQGTITVEGKTWLDTLNRINIKPRYRNTGFVFQDYALFPNMTIKENIEFALGHKKEKDSINEIIEIFELGELQYQKPGNLSGGQKQRAALARTLVMNPDLLLLDEPLSSVDIKMRTKLQDYILQVHRQKGFTSIMVSHDVGEIFKMSDEVLLIEEGKISRTGSPSNIFSNRHISGKFQFTGAVAAIEKDDVIYIITVLIGNHLVKVVADQSEIKELKVGDKVMVASKAFNPIIQKIQ